MKKNTELLEKRRQFIHEYALNNQDKQVDVIIAELSDILFLSERTIYNILNQEIIAA